MWVNYLILQRFHSGRCISVALILVAEVVHHVIDDPVLTAVVFEDVTDVG